MKISAPTYTPPPPDPLVTQAETQAQTQLVQGLQTQARSDTASLMAQYGALASAFGAASPSPSAVGAANSLGGKVG